MARNLEITPKIEAQIRAVLDDDQVDVSNLVVFEAFFASTHPLTKPGSIFHRGRISRSLLVQMANYVNSGNPVPLHTLHNAGDELPVGTVFFARVEDSPDGESNLRGLFFLPRNKTELVADVNSGTINEVSIGVKSKKLLCSECGFDFIGPEATFMNLFEHTCDEGHVLGEEGVFAQIIDLDVWVELSLVGKGAGRNPRILSRSKSLLSEETIERLAASGIAPEAVVLFATCEEIDMSKEQANGGGSETVVPGLKDLFTMHATQSAELATVNALVEALTAQVSTLTAERDELKTNLEAAEASKTDDEKAVQEKLDAAVAQLAAVTEFLKEHTKAALVAAGQNDPQVPEGVTEMVAAITTSGMKLHQIVGAGGQSQGATATAEAKAEEARAKAFKTRN